MPHFRSGVLLSIALRLLERRRPEAPLISVPSQQGDRLLLAGPYSEETREPRHGAPHHGDPPLQSLRRGHDRCPESLLTFPGTPRHGGGGAPLLPTSLEGESGLSVGCLRAVPSSHWGHCHPQLAAPNETLQPRGEVPVGTGGSSHWEAVGALTL